METLVLVSWIYPCTRLPAHLTDKGSADGEESGEVVPSDELILVELPNIDRVWLSWAISRARGKHALGAVEYEDLDSRKAWDGKELIICPSIALAFLFALMLICKGYGLNILI